MLGDRRTSVPNQVYCSAPCDQYGAEAETLFYGCDNGAERVGMPGRVGTCMDIKTLR